MKKNRLLNYGLPVLAILAGGVRVFLYFVRALSLAPILKISP